MSRITPIGLEWILKLGVHQSLVAQAKEAGKSHTNETAVRTDCHAGRFVEMDCLFALYSQGILAGQSTNPERLLTIAHRRNYQVREKMLAIFPIVNGKPKKNMVHYELAWGVQEAVIYQENDAPQSSNP